MYNIKKAKEDFYTTYLKKKTELESKLPGR